MFQCDYCGAQFLEHQSKCPHCGALIKASSVTEQARNGGANIRPIEGEAEALRKVCVKFEGTKGLYSAETIDARRMQVVRQNFKIPEAETVIMVYDDTIFGNNKKGFAICRGGLYWKNDWAVETRRNFLTWQDFTERSIQLDKFIITLGRGDQIGTAGTGDDTAREQITALLNEVKAVLLTSGSTMALTGDQ